VGRKRPGSFVKDNQQHTFLNWLVLHGGQEEAGLLRRTRSTAYISELIGFAWVGRKRPGSFAKPYPKQKYALSIVVGPVRG
jgi:hypothetical protein